MGTPHKHAALIKAWADGAKIEYWSEQYNCWRDFECNPNWENANEYRIKPKTESL